MAQGERPRRLSPNAVPQDPRKAAEFYRDLKFWPVPFKPRSKEPAIKRWQQADDPSRFLGALTLDSNVAILLGEPSGWLTECDLDCSIAAKAAAMFLPETCMISGRVGAPRSHWWWLARLERSLRFVDPACPDGTRAMILELRSAGCATLAPPSVHPSGERVRWESWGKPPSVDVTRLVLRATLLAICTLMARHWPKTGIRQDVALALSGLLLHRGIDEADAKLCLRSIAKFVGDREIEKRVGTVASTAGRLRKQQSVAAAARLGELIPTAVVQTIESWLARAMGADGSDGPDALLGRSSPVDSLVRMLQDDLSATFIRSRSRNSAAFVSVESRGGVRTYSVKSRGFKLFLGSAFGTKFGRSCRSKDIDEAVGIIEGECLCNGVEEDIHVRVARTGDRVYVDMGDDANRVIDVGPEGWNVMPKCGVKFVRSSGSLPLPVPEREGHVDDLWRFVNIKDPGDRLLVLVWLTMALGRPDVPCPIKFIHGEQGTAKSTSTKCLHLLVDPSAAPLRSPPPERRSLAIAADRARVLSFDNWSQFKPDMSDAFCQLVTGGAFAVRALYEDAEEQVFSARRAIIVNGIPDLARQQDLIGRSLMFVLPQIEKRRREEDLDKEFATARPGILGKLLDAVSVGLARMSEVDLDDVELDRMADFCAWGCAVAPAFGSTRERFLRALSRNRTRSEGAAIEASPIIEPLRTVVSKKPFLGTATDLLKELKIAASTLQESHPEWPTAAVALGRLVRREAGAMRRAGFVVETDRMSKDKSPRRLIYIDLRERERKLPRRVSDPSGVRKPRRITPPDCNEDERRGWERGLAE